MVRSRRSRSVRSGCRVFAVVGTGKSHKVGADAFMRFLSVKPPQLSLQLIMHENVTIYSLASELSGSSFDVDYSCTSLPSFRLRLT